ncbi:hypothetical protein HS088_TW02G00286 [Tripterygium wilfordii]|uniref:Uncharacterized protein n=1 Tax=Tripterygium wilfordii TaxID=458696 RepID=A0A7J7DYL0_TRIWF|nr:hypothetical protein HS088_TW02G00286 [Tripterygium wilfordii]
MVLLGLGYSPSLIPYGYDSSIIMPKSRFRDLANLAILTGGEVIFEERGVTLDKVKVQDETFGTAKKARALDDITAEVTVSLDHTIILHGGGDKQLIEERCEQLYRITIRISIEKSTAVFYKHKSHERLSKLSGCPAVFKVGGASEAEVGERKERVTDALNATRASVEEGIVAGKVMFIIWRFCLSTRNYNIICFIGGGVALLYASKILTSLQTENELQKRGAPTLTIALNAGFDGTLVLGKLLEQDDHNWGFDAARGSSALAQFPVFVTVPSSKLSPLLPWFSAMRSSLSICTRLSRRFAFVSLVAT